MYFLKLVILTYFTLTAFSLSFSIDQTPCTSDDWFGANCEYQCHCAGSAPCDKHDGSCSSGCHRDWYGPACQYARMGFTVNGNFNSGWLTDNKDTTCNRGTLRSVTVTLDTPIPLTWLRVVISDAVNLNMMFISYRNESSPYTECPESNTAEINRVTIDISCPTEYPITSVTLSGQGVNYLCSLYISAGRNVALAQRAKQSSWFNYLDRKHFLAEHAVDGQVPNNERSSNFLTCTHTDTGDKSPWWNVSFTQPVEITRFILENRRDCCQERLKNFLLTVYPVNDSYKPIEYRGSYNIKTTYLVVPSPRISFPVHQVKITEGFNPDRFLTLCEVFIFGEIHCPSNRYGLSCERECNCVNQTRCFVHSGGCPSGCAPGYTGLDCSEACPIGKHGPGCNTTCSGQCVGQHNPCHHIDGSCYLGCVQDDQSPMCRRTSSGQKRSSHFVPLVVIIIAAAAVIIGLLVWRLRMATRHQPQKSTLEDCCARVELVQVENSPLAPQPGALARRGSNQHYEPLTLSPYNNDLDQYATPLDMLTELGEYETPLTVKTRQVK